MTTQPERRPQQDPDPDDQDAEPTMTAPGAARPDHVEEDADDGSDRGQQV